MSASGATRKVLTSILFPSSTIGTTCVTWNSNRFTSGDRTRCESSRDDGSHQDDVERDQDNKTSTPAPSSKVNAKIQKRMTAIGHFSLKTETLANPSVPTFFLALSNPPTRSIFSPSLSETLNSNEFSKTWFQRRMHEKHPRFHSRVSSTEYPGYFTPITTSSGSSSLTPADFAATHVQETLHMNVYRAELKSRIENLVAKAMDVKEKMWQVQICSGKLGSSGAISQKRCENIKEKYGTDSKLKETVMIFKCHHSIADGVSLVAALGDLLDEAEDIQSKIQMELRKRRAKGAKLTLLQRCWRFLQKLIWFLFGSIQALAHQGYLMWITPKNPFLAVLNLTQKDAERMSVSLGRTVSWCDVASVDEVKRVAKLLGGPRATVNDVFVSCVTAAVARQLAEHRKRVTVNADGKHHTNSEHIQERINVVIPTHLAGGILPPGREIGNLIGAFVARVPGEVNSRQSSAMLPSQRLKIVHSSLDKGKRSPAPILSYAMAKLSAKWLPESWAVRIFYCSSANAAVAITNSRGHDKKLHLNGRTIESMAGFLPLPPGLPLGVVVQSYGNEMSISINAEKWAVPDADRFLTFVLEEYQSLCKEASLKEDSTGSTK